MPKIIIWPFVVVLQVLIASAQTKPANKPATQKPESASIPISNAELGTFPYFKTFPNFYPRNYTDSLTLEQNRAYFFDGKKFFYVDGKVSSQILRY